MSYMQLGPTPSNMTLEIPYPDQGKAMFETSSFVDSGRNANGAIVGQQVGRSIDKQNMGWSVLDAETWWAMNNWIEKNGMFFYCRYFSHNFGEWRTRRFYCSDFKAEPGFLNPDTGKPEFYMNCSFNVIDVGE